MTLRPATACLLIALTLTTGGCELHWADSKPAGAGQMPAEPVRGRPQPRPATPKALEDIAIGPEARMERRDTLLEQIPIDLAELGYFMDVYEARLRQVLAGTEFGYVREEQGFVITLPGSQTFASNSSSLMESILSKLQSLADVFGEFNQTLITVHGHTDDRGDENYNKGLSRERAVTVADYIVARGVDRRRLVAIGHGEETPRADNSTADGRAMNRRIEIEIEVLVRAGAEGDNETPDKSRPLAPRKPPPAPSGKL